MKTTFGGHAARHVWTVAKLVLGAVALSYGIGLVVELAGGPFYLDMYFFGLYCALGGAFFGHYAVRRIS